MLSSSFAPFCLVLPLSMLCEKQYRGDSSVAGELRGVDFGSGVACLLLAVQPEYVLWLMFMLHWTELRKYDRLNQGLIWQGGVLWMVVAKTISILISVYVILSESILSSNTHSYRSEKENAKQVNLTKTRLGYISS